MEVQARAMEGFMTKPSDNQVNSDELLYKNVGRKKRTMGRPVLMPWNPPQNNQLKPKEK